MKRTNENDNLAFYKINSYRAINCVWEKKTSDTGVVLTFCICSSIQHKKNNVESTVHRVFRSTTTWHHDDKAVKES